MRRGPGTLVPISLVLVLAACGSSDRLPVYPVRGKILYRGEPAAHAFVVLHSEGGSESVQKLRPHAYTNTDGTFSITTYARGDGAPAGEYRVTVMCPSVPRGADPNDPDEVTGPDRLGGRYLDPETTPLSITVSEQENHLDAFELR